MPKQLKTMLYISWGLLVADIIAALVMTAVQLSHG